MKPSDQKKNGLQRVLDAPINLADLAATAQTTTEDVSSIWVVNRDDNLVSICNANFGHFSNLIRSSFHSFQLGTVMKSMQKVDSKKLEKAQQKLQQKQEKRSEAPKAPVMPLQLKTATASQVMNKRDTQMDAKGTNRSMDIRIENFDVSFGNKVLLQNADLLLASGRRYGLVGRNGLGKTTLLRMIADKQLQIPSHISILHVEQEVTGDDTTALNR